MPAMWVIPKEAAGGRVLLCIRGGGFTGGSICTHRKLSGHLARQAGARALIFNCRLAPEHRHPAPLDDAIRRMAAWVRPKLGLVEAAGAATATQPSHRACAGRARGLTGDHLDITMCP
jgi:acetyl esterase/lipase